MPDMPEAMREFAEAAISGRDMALPWHYPKVEDWQSLQSGFRTHGISGENLVGTEDGQWRPGWFVIALNGFGDPFFIDLGEEAAAYPVYYSPHGAGHWDAVLVASSLREFGAMLQSLAALDDDDTALQYLESHTDESNPLWSEVRAARRESVADESHAAEEKAEEKPVDPTAWQHGTLLITRLGPHKLKVVHLLKQHLNLTPQQALAVTGALPVSVGRDYLIRLRSIRQELEAVGAQTEFQPDAPALQTFEKNVFFSIEELIACFKARQERECSYAIYSARGEAFAAGEQVFVADGVEVNDQDEEIHPAAVRRLNLQFAYSGELFQDVIDLAISQKPQATDSEILQALNHYSEFDDFLDLG